MPKTYCHDCIHCDSARHTCQHRQGSEFLAYIVRCAGAKVDASDCPGFKPVKGGFSD